MAIPELLGFPRRGVQGAYNQTRSTGSLPKTRSTGMESFSFSTIMEKMYRVPHPQPRRTRSRHRLFNQLYAWFGRRREPTFFLVLEGKKLLRVAWGHILDGVGNDSPVAAPVGAVPQQRWRQGRPALPDMQSDVAGGGCQMGQRFVRTCGRTRRATGEG